MSHTRALRFVDEAIFAETLARAATSARGRTNFNLHAGADDPVHRFLNVFRRGSYVTPHRHVSPDKTETFLVLRGEMAVFLFDDEGEVLEVHRLGDPSQRALPCCIDLSAGWWHSIASLSDEAICFEVKPGPWSPATDKDFAPWAPREGVASAAACDAYLASLIAQLEGDEMKVLRIVANVATPDPSLAKAFYGDLLGLDVLMDQGWIVTLGSTKKAPVQISFASEGGSGTEVPDLSIEVDDLDEALARMKAAKVPIVYGPTEEPWHVRRFFVRDPFGRLVNVLTHG